MGEGGVRMNSRRSILRKIAIIFLAGCISVLGVTCCVNLYIIVYACPYIITDERNMPQVEALLIPGAMVYSSGKMSRVLADRVNTGLRLYRAHPGWKLLVSGDHGTRYYDEVNAMKKYLLRENVPLSDILLDHAGFDTYDSVTRARDVFRVRRVLIVTQRFHLSRALFIARKQGLDAYGFYADKRRYKDALRFAAREYLARLKAFYEVFAGRKVNLP